MENLVKLLLVITLLKAIVWAGIVPIWHFPDEQAHFAQVSLYSETGRMRADDKRDLSEEILISEKLLGTERDWAGRNKFTFHPEYKIEYTDTVVGKYEKEINNIALDKRKNFIKHESAAYPPLYYWLGSFFYKLFYQQSLIIRVFAVRFLSILLFIATVFFAFKSAELLFPKNKVLAQAVAVMVSFQPMFTFVGSGVSSDVLFNLLFMIFIYLCLLIINNGLKAGYLSMIMFLFYLGNLTKRHFIITAPILLGALAIFTLRKRKKKINLLTVLLLVSTMMMALWKPLNNWHQGKNVWPDIKPVWRWSEDYISLPSFVSWTVRHTIAEVIPWYWGVFKWLGVVLPPIVNRIINRMMVLAGLGLLWRFVKVVRRGRLSKLDWNLIFLIWANLVYFAVLMYWAWLFRNSQGFNFGFQGRYYFPLIFSHMVLFLTGFLSLTPKRWRSAVAKLTGMVMVLLNFIALIIVAGGYYDLSSFNTFIIQASQYKPIIFKGNFFVGWLALYFSVLIYFSYKYLKYESKKA